MPTAKKAEALAELEDKVTRASVAISTAYRGMKVADMTALRRRMREAGVEVEVVKNTLLRIASERAGRPEITRIVEGPTAMIFSYGDIAVAAKAVTEYIRVSRSALTIQGAYLDGAILGPAEVGDLANLPSRETLIAQFVGGMQSPVATFAGLITSVVRDFAGLIDARAQQIEGSAA
jgi:large subunit ribosomal protein L10